MFVTVLDDIMKLNIVKEYEKYTMTLVFHSVSYYALTAVITIYKVCITSQYINNGLEPQG